jgi:hypothetical protein
MPDNVTIPAACMGDLLGPPPVITGEDAKEFEELLDRAREDVKPADIIEEIWVRDVVELARDIRRLRRLKASLLQAIAQRGCARCSPRSSIGWTDTGCRKHGRGATGILLRR